MADYSIDLETLDVGSYAAILNVGICKFNLQTGKILDTKQIHIDIDDQLNRGFKISRSTLTWWMGQSPQAQIASFVHPYANNKALPVAEAAKEITDFITHPARVWGNGPGFDCQKLADLYCSVGRKTPWQFYQERCLRTAVDMANLDKSQVPFEGVEHNSLDDAVHQAKLAHMAYKQLEHAACK